MTTANLDGLPDTPLVLSLDGWDAQAVRAAMSQRKRFFVPDGGGNEDGRLIAEICRGWMEFMCVEWTPEGGAK